jgi:hypothetical protein
VHEEDETRAYLAENGVVLIELRPGNLTHLVQIPDSSLLHGNLQKRILAHQEKPASRDTDLMQPSGLQDLIDCCRAAFTGDNIRQAASSMGFEYSFENGIYRVRIDDDTIARFVARLERENLIHQDTKVGKSTHLLRKQWMQGSKQLKVIGYLPGCPLIPVDALKELALERKQEYDDHEATENPNLLSYKKPRYYDMPKETSYDSETKVLQSSECISQNMRFQAETEAKTKHASLAKRQMQETKEKRKAHLKRLHPDIDEETWKAANLNRVLSKYNSETSISDVHAEQLIARALARLKKREEKTIQTN